MFKDNQDAFEYLFQLAKTCRKRNLLQAADFLDELLSGRGASTSGEHIGMISVELTDFLAQFGKHFTEQERQMIEAARVAHAEVYAGKH